MTGASSLKCNSLAEDIKLSTHGRHPIAYPFISCCFYFHFILFLFFLFSIFILVFCFLGTSVLEFKFGGNTLSPTYSRQFHPSPG
jgi:hypothetical protein